MALAQSPGHKNRSSSDVEPSTPIVARARRGSSRSLQQAQKTQSQKSGLGSSQDRDQDRDQNVAARSARPKHRSLLPNEPPTPIDPSQPGLALDRLYPGDCLDLFARVPSGSVDLIFADPPFNIGYDYDVYDDRRDADAYLEWTRAWGREVVRALKPTGAFWLAIGDEYAAELKVLFHRELGLTPRSWVVWYYTFGVHCTKKFTRSHAHLFHFVKDPKRFTFNDQDIRVPSARQLIYRDKRANARGRLPDDTWILRPQDVPDGFAPGSDTWYFPRVCGTFKERAGWHGCQMPEQLLGRIIRACSNEGDTVLDPFGGSGTTLAVAKKLHRRFLGSELSPDYAAAIQARLDAIEPGEPLLGAAEPLAGGVGRGSKTSS